MDNDPPIGPADTEPVPGRARRAGLFIVVGLVGLLGVGISARTGRLDSALLFVGVPCLLALLVGLIPGEKGWAAVFQTITIVLLLSSALLHEGALCVMLASPLVYGVAGIVYTVDRWGRRSARFALAPLLIVVAIEGAVPGARIDPTQEASATKFVAADCAAFESALARGPVVQPGLDRGRLLHIARYPTPVAVTGTGLDVGDTWSLQMPDGVISTRVVARGSRELAFAVTEDTARTTRWIALQTGRLRWSETGDGCRATLTIRYQRKLDPSFWFGPITDVFMDAGARALLNALD